MSYLASFDDSFWPSSFLPPPPQRSLCFYCYRFFICKQTVDQANINTSDSSIYKLVTKTFFLKSSFLALPSRYYKKNINKICLVGKTTLMVKLPCSSQKWSGYHVQGRCAHHVFYSVRSY